MTRGPHGKLPPSTVSLPLPRIGESPQIRAVWAEVDRVAARSITVLLTGQTGTGKSMVAKMIHAGSPRADGPFVPLNCASLPDTLIERDLFGAEAGSHSTATETQHGLFAAADGGTLFLDEIGELSLLAQAKLLTALDDGTFRRVGATEVSRSDVRIIAATHHDLDALVRAGRFRSDLRYRVDEYPIHIPKLDDRRADIVPIARHTLAGLLRPAGDRDPRFSLRAERWLMQRSWPGNVRELQTAIRRAAVRADGAETIDVHHFGAPRADVSLAAATASFKAAYVRQVLEAEKWNMAAAARALGISRSGLYVLVDDLELRAS